MLANLTAPIPARAESDSVSAVKTAAISATGLGKRYKLYTSPWHRAAEWMSLSRRVRHEDFWALKDINFSVGEGKSLGIIGVNGAGKSTLLKILTGCLSPTEGTFEVRGRILSLLELGTGMNSQLTGRQNVLNGSELLAMPQGYAQEKMGDIESFAELGAFFDKPVRQYSTGMMVRLAFSMFVALEPDVFIVDEALSVGDIFFQQKCARRIKQLRERGTTLLFVSHDLGAIEALCDQVLVLHRGRQQHFGDKVKGINLYYSLAGTMVGHQPGAARAADASVPRTVDRPAPAPRHAPDENSLPTLDETELSQLPWSPPGIEEGIDNGQVRFDGICLRNGEGDFSPIVQHGQNLDILVRMRVTEDLAAVNVGVTLFDRFHQLLFSQGWTNAQLQPLAVTKGQTVYAGFRIRMDLAWGGEYVIAVGASEALAQADSPTGWNQSYGGELYFLSPRCAVVTVAAPANHFQVDWFGPANLRTSLQRRVTGGDS